MSIISHKKSQAVAVLHACLLLIGCSTAIQPELPTAPTPSKDQINLYSDVDRIRLMVESVEGSDGVLRFNLRAWNSSPESKNLPLENFVVQDQLGQIYKPDLILSNWSGRMPANGELHGSVALSYTLLVTSDFVRVGFSGLPSQRDIFVNAIPTKPFDPPYLESNIESTSQYGLRLRVTRVEEIWGVTRIFFTTINDSPSTFYFPASLSEVVDEDGRSYPVLLNASDFGPLLNDRGISYKLIPGMTMRSSYATIARQIRKISCFVSFGAVFGDLNIFAQNVQLPRGNCRGKIPPPITPIPIVAVREQYQMPQPDWRAVFSSVVTSTNHIVP